MNQANKGLVNFLQEFSIPLIAGVFVALVHANLDAEQYHHLLEWMPLGAIELFGKPATLHFLVNDVFMVFFFGIAAKEITEAVLPGGTLSPLRKAINPLLATLGGVVGPICVFFAALWVAMGADAFPADAEWSVLARGWGIPTATDIALAWLVARTVFGRGHPAINFLLLLAVADDAIGLAIIAIFYGDVGHPAEPVWLLLVGGGMALALTLRLLGTKAWVPYIFLAGPLAWSGLVLANLHPALALVFVVPFLPGPARDTGLFVEADEIDRGLQGAGGPLHEHSALHQFEHNLKLVVDLGLFFFAYANAGVALSVVGPMTWIVLGSLVVGKTVGITLFGWIGTRIGFPLPDRMGMRELTMAGFVAALGLTVALFVAGAAFAGGPLQDQAKMGALFSGFVGIVALGISRLTDLRGRRTESSARAEGSDPEGPAERLDAVSGAAPEVTPAAPLPTSGEPAGPLQRD